MLIISVIPRTIDQDEGWVVCKVFKKRVATVQRMSTDSPFWVNDHVAFVAPHVDSPRQAMHHLQNALYNGHQQSYYNHHPCKVELEYHHLLPQEPMSFLQLPQLESPRLPDLIGAVATLQQPSILTRHGDQASSQQLQIDPVYATDASAAADWRDLDKFMASQLISHGESNLAKAFQVEQGKQEEALDYVSTSASGGGGNDLWK